MTYSSFIVKAPGKLMIAGEYAVLEPKQKAVVTAINRYITAEIEPCSHNRLSLPHYELDNITWENTESSVQFNVHDSRLKFIQNSISVVTRFLQENKTPIKPFHLTVKSELDDPALGIKYGLGSSAAIVAAVISAILIFHRKKNEPIILEQLFKLSVIAHIMTQKNGSGADIAAAVFGGWLAYSAFNQEWLLNRLKQKENLNELIIRPWPDLSITPIKKPENITFCAGWTKEPASTAPMVKKIQEFSNENPQDFMRFLDESKKAVEQLIKSFAGNDVEMAIASLAKNQHALTVLGEKSGADIETTKLKDLCSIAERFGGGKSSGAGGGDCGIAFLRNGREIEKLYQEWKEKGIEPLELTISQTGVEVAEYTCAPSIEEYLKRKTF
ncbi:phosphomevalonate kinase [Neobacillus mesonae]|uniref:phosphomevalonate kinase n=1 Tax=Neobacillus mesonae TaxID=1193713 RepID=UPI0020406198|nr:phosphomevalonate kinase [Neobacillus mesonae]MCM3571219.1 phosphomevalonate kinase [Neobacillus mesonae]